MSQPRAASRFYLVLILGLLTAIGPFSIDMYLPAFPSIATSLHTTVSRVMLSLSSFFIGISAGQLVYGPLLERFGRKKPLYIGIIIYLLSSVGCALASSIDALIVFRLLQALGSCAGLVTARAIVRDVFEVSETAKIFSLLMLVVAVSPIIAPTTGSYLTALFGWRSVFVALIVISAAILVGVHFFLPESKPPDPGFSLRPTAILTSYMTILKHPQFYTYAFTGAIAYGGLCAYISGSPFVFMTLFNVSEKQYGWVFAIIAIGIIGASQLNNLALKHRTSEQVIRIALLCQGGVGLALAFFTLLGWSELYSTIFLLFLFLGGQGFIFPNASALSLAPFGHNAGSASALMGAIQMSVGAAASGLVSLLQNQTAFPMAGTMAFCSSTASLVLWLGRKRLLQQASPNAVREEEIEMISTL